jgi:hypothetical protein
MNMEKNVNDEIARVAYGIYENRGCTPGNDFTDWLEAERIVKQKHAARMTSDVKPVKPTPPMKATASTKAKSRGQLNRPSAT